MIYRIGVEERRCAYALHNYNLASHMNQWMGEPHPHNALSSYVEMIHILFLEHSLDLTSYAP